MTVNFGATVSTERGENSGERSLKMTPSGHTYAEAFLVISPVSLSIPSTLRRFETPSREEHINSLNFVFNYYDTPLSHLN